MIDVGKDDEGMRVLADLHGGDLEDREAKIEFREIKEKVMADVSPFNSCSFTSGLIETHLSEKLEIRDLTRLCGISTSGECFSPCLLRHLLNS